MQVLGFRSTSTSKLLANMEGGRTHIRSIKKDLSDTSVLFMPSHILQAITISRLQGVTTANVLLHLLQVSFLEYVILSHGRLLPGQ